ncbi:MAG TPA: hypothetical protein PK325_04780 [Cyclobacteriaceae bacterium]|nr:hypothetical protein [Cyclobacteriaceae bacterium]HMV08219.1 hypothetical protein [Cyclobacteriaceae bacterium]HMV89079.1 hypothetical protein [Cyclobacteriaceae bacterium]HMX02062.1 hypothetical protein [Cyclobacteriaceae bacterium]HMX49962.1 hypothetical protein [Cyclobacteriaceae bacterium]
MRIYIVVLLALISFCSHGQYKAEEFQAVLLEAKYGALLLYNGTTNSFSIRFESNSVKPTDKPNFILVDNVLMQSLITPFRQKLDFNNLDNATQKRYLTGWKAYEKKWVEDQLKIALKEEEEFIEISDRVFLYWTFGMPKSKDSGSVDSQVYLVTICFDQLLILNGPVEKGKQAETLKEKFVTIAKTLTLSPNQIQDIEKLYNELKK